MFHRNKKKTVKQNIRISLEQKKRPQIVKMILYKAQGWKHALYDFKANYKDSSNQSLAVLTQKQT